MKEGIGLVLEGGGMRGVFTAGVLDCFIDNGIYFPYTIGVSAGCSHGLSYASRQRGRAKFIDTELLKEYNYISLKHLLTKSSIMDNDYLYYTLAKDIYPYDFEAYLKSGKFTIVATDCNTGKAKYFNNAQSFNRLLDYCKASCSLPYLCPITHIDNTPYLDGGISDAIPLKKSISDGNTKNVVVLTRNKGFEKKSYYNFIAKFMYKKYPNFLTALKKAHIDYNENLRFVEKLEAEGSIIVIRPENKIKVSRLEHNINKLNELYEEAYSCTKKVIDKIKSL